MLRQERPKEQVHLRHAEAQRARVHAPRPRAGGHGRTPPGGAVEAPSTAERLKCSIPRDEKFIRDADDVSGYFMQYIEALGYDYPKDYVKKLLDNSYSDLISNR